MSKIIVKSAAVSLFVTVGIGLWDAVQQLHTLAAAVALLFGVGAILNSWAA
jgi:hypothetical protein